jgi:hypothetical protein
MQQKGDRKLRCSTNKGRIPSDMVENMENTDRKCEDYFQALNKPSELAEEDKIKNLKVLKEFVESFGLNIDLE